MAQTFIDRLAIAFERAGNPSKRGVAAKAGLHENYFSDLADETTQNPRIDTARKIADSLGCNADWLAYGQGAADDVMMPGEYFELLPEKRELVDALIRQLVPQHDRDAS